MAVAKRKLKHGSIYEVNFRYKEKGIPKRYTKRGFKTKKEAERHESEVRKQLIDKGYIQKEIRLTLNEVFDEFIRTANIDYQHNTIYGMKKCKKYFENTIGKFVITEIRHKDLQTFFNSRANEGLQMNKSIRKALHGAFVFAIRNEYITSNPLEYVKVKGEDRSQPKEPISYEDYQELIKKLKNRNTFRYDAYAVAIQIGYYTGLRISEVLALEKSDIDFDKNIIDVNKKLNYKGLKESQYNVTHEMKSKKSKAIIPLPEQLKDILEYWYSINPYDKVVCNEKGEYINPTSLGNAVRTIAKHMGIDFHFHLLRHTYATTLVFNNVDIKIAQELMRHSSSDTTLSLYTHVREKSKIDIVNSVFNKNGVDLALQDEIKNKPLA